MAVPYQRPQGFHRIEHRVSNSQFITSVDCVTSPEQAKSFIKQIRDEMPDASHHAYAFRVGHGNSVIDGMSDDGEPSGTAGPPTLAVLRGSELGDIALVTTRYFGGTKLGTGGLVRSYSEAARLALKSLPVEYKIDKSVLGVDIPYTYYEQLKRLLPDYDVEVDDEDFQAEVSVTLILPDEQLQGFEQAVLDLTHGKAQVVVLGSI